MNRRALVGTLLGALLLGALVGWWLLTFERVEIEVPAPPRGEARYNPLFGLKKALQERGIKVDARANFNARAVPLAPNDTLVLGADARTLSRSDVDTLIAWIERGGHLVFAVPHGRNRSGELLDRLRLGQAERYACLSWSVAGETDRASYCLSTFRPLERSTVYAQLLGEKGKDTYWLARRERGDGGWTALGDLRFLQNNSLKQPGYAAFAWQVLAPTLHDGGTVHLVYSTEVPPLHVLLLRYGWPALVPALAALLAWLWLRSQRLGPLLPVAAPHRRALREHIQSAGEFTFRRGRGLALYAPLKRAFDARLRREDALLAALPDDALAQELAKRNGVSPAVVQMALQPQDLGDAERFHLTIKTLTTLRARP